MEICNTEKPPQFAYQGDQEHTVSCHLYSGKEAEQS
jgi:hypothetical protein